VIGDTKANLKAAAAGENYEWTEMYPTFAMVAREEGFIFVSIAKAEEAHETRYLTLPKNIQGSRVFKRDQVVKWKCRNSGYIHEGSEAPRECSACAHPQSYFELWCANY